MREEWAAAQHRDNGLVIRERKLGLALALFGAAGILVATLSPVAHPIPAHFESHCYACGPTGTVDVLLNLLLFAPLGFGLGLARWRWWVVALICTGLSAFVETMQLFVIPGRDSSLSDWVNNSAGGTIAFLLAAHWRAAVFPPPRRAAMLAAGAGALVCALFLGTGVLMRPDVEGPGTVRLRSSDAAYLYYPGAVFGGAFVGTPVRPSGPDSLWQPGPGRDVVVGHDTPLTGWLDVTVGPPTLDFAPAGGVYVGSSARIILAEEKTWLMYSVRLRAARAKLRHPGVTIARFFPTDGASAFAARGDTVRIWGEVHADTIRVGAIDGARRVVRDLILSPFLGWTTILFWTFKPGESAVAAVTALWVAALLVPSAYWGARAARARRAAGAIAPAVMLAGVVGVPALLHATPAQWFVWVGAVAGVAVGTLLAAAAWSVGEPMV